jgi:hypothetical protein
VDTVARFTEEEDALPVADSGIGDMTDSEDDVDAVDGLRRRWPFTASELPWEDAGVALRERERDEGPADDGPASLSMDVSMRKRAIVRRCSSSQELACSKGALSRSSEWLDLCAAGRLARWTSALTSNKRPALTSVAHTITRSLGSPSPKWKAVGRPGRGPVRKKLDGGSSGLASAWETFEPNKSLGQTVPHKPAVPTQSSAFTSTLPSSSAHPVGVT